MKKLKVDPSKCRGYQVCIAIAPDVFKMNEENKSIVKNQTGADEAAIQSAIDACPTQAIKWVE